MCLRLDRLHPPRIAQRIHHRQGEDVALDAITRREQGDGTWLDISILGGTMVAYERDKPVYATLVSPGRGGVPKHGVDPLETASTPVGRFRVTGKFLTATMVSDGDSFQDIEQVVVPPVKNFLDVEVSYDQEDYQPRDVECAAVGLALHPDFKSAVKAMTHVGEVYEPDQNNHRLYNQLYHDVYRKMYKRLKPLYERIREITGYPK